MLPSDAEAFSSDSNLPEETAEYRGILGGSRASAERETVTYGDEIWRWEFEVCNSVGEVMNYVRVNAFDELSAAAEARRRIDADRTLGSSVRVRLAVEK